MHLQVIYGCLIPFFLYSHALARVALEKRQNEAIFICDNEIIDQNLIKGTQQHIMRHIMGVHDGMITVLPEVTQKKLFGTFKERYYMSNIISSSKATRLHKSRIVVDNYGNLQGVVYMSRDGDLLMCKETIKLAPQNIKKNKAVLNFRASTLHPPGPSSVSMVEGFNCGGVTWSKKSLHRLMSQIWKTRGDKDSKIKPFHTMSPQLGPSALLFANHEFKKLWAASIRFKQDPQADIYSAIVHDLGNDAFDILMFLHKRDGNRILCQKQMVPQGFKAQPNLGVKSAKMKASSSKIESKLVDAFQRHMAAGDIGTSNPPITPYILNSHYFKVPDARTKNHPSFNPSADPEGSLGSSKLLPLDMLDLSLGQTKKTPSRSGHRPNRPNTGEWLSLGTSGPLPETGTTSASSSLEEIPDASSKHNFFPPAGQSSQSERATKRKYDPEVNVELSLGGFDPRRKGASRYQIP